MRGTEQDNCTLLPHTWILDELYNTGIIKGYQRKFSYQTSELRVSIESVHVRVTHRKMSSLLRLPTDAQNS